MIYLDNAATTLIKPVSVEQAMCRAMENCASPGRGGHRPAMRAAELVYRCRERAAKLAKILLAQAKLIADLPLDDPSAYAELVCGLF